MKKLLFLGGLNPGGAEHQMVVLARLLKKQGYDVTYLCGDKSNFFQKDLEEAGVPIIRIKDNKLATKLKLSIPRTTIKLHKILKQGKYDTVISFLGEWNYQNCLLADRKSTSHRAITGIRNNRDEVFLNSKRKFYTRFEHYAYRKVSNSKAAQLRFAQHFPQLAPKLMTIYNIVDLPPIVSSYTCKKDGKVNIIVPASYREVKNPMRFLEAVALMPIEKKESIRIDWYGNIKAGQTMYNRMQEYIHANHLENAVVLHDATTDIANRINEADMVGLFSTSEGLPNSICEGMMLGKPIIMTRVSDYDVLVDESNGFLCDADSPQSISQALSLAAGLTASEIESLGHQSKQKAQALFSEKAILEQWKQII